MPPFREVTLPKDELARMAAFVERAIPREACGLLGGRIDRARLHVKIYPAVNDTRSLCGFLIRSRQFQELERQIESDGLSLCGCYHSHPRGAARPSVADQQMSTRPSFLWIICAPARRSTKAFWWNGRRFLERPIGVEP